MGYTALTQVRKINAQRYGIDAPKSDRDRLRCGYSGMQGAAARFISDHCEGLLFSQQTRHLTFSDSDGRSLKPYQIPINMEHDIDRLCLENAVVRFVETCKAADAFDVCFCFCQMFLGGFDAESVDCSTSAAVEFAASLALYDCSGDIRDRHSDAHRYLEQCGRRAFIHTDPEENAPITRRSYSIELPEAPEWLQQEVNALLERAGQGECSYLYEAAVLLMGGNDEQKLPFALLEKRFCDLSLEYKLAHISRIKQLQEFLNQNGYAICACGQSADSISELPVELLVGIAPFEHRRWLLEHRELGWSYGDEYEKQACSIEEARTIRELTRTHKLLLSDGDYSEERIRAHFDELDEAEQAKDYSHIVPLLKTMNRLSGLRVVCID